MSNFVLKKTRRNLKTEKDETIFFCFDCEKERLKEEDAERCIKENELVLVPIARNDLGRLQQFFYLKEDKLLTEPLINIIKRYARSAARR